MYVGTGRDLSKTRNERETEIERERKTEIK